MSTNKSASMTYKYQSKTKYTRASAPIAFKSTSTTQIKPGRFSSYKPSTSKMVEDLSNYYLYNYIFQDRPDETNTVFFDSNLRKYRTRSSKKTQGGSALSKTYNNPANLKALKKDSNYSVNKNTYSLKGLKGIGLNENKNINIPKETKKENAQTKFTAKGNSINDNKRKQDSDERAEIIRQLKKEKDELLGTSSSNYSSSKKNLEKPQDEKSISNQNRKSNLNINTGKTLNKLGDVNINIKNLKGSSKNGQSEQTKSQRSPMKKNDKKIESSKLNKTSQQPEKQNSNQKRLSKADITQKSGSSNLGQNTQNIKDSKPQQTTQPFQAKQNLSQRNPVKNAQLEGSKQINTSQLQAKQTIQQAQSQKEKTITQKSPLKQSPIKEDSISPQKKIENNNQNISEDNKKSSGFMNKDIPQSLSNNQYQKEANTYQNNMKINNEDEQLRESNVSVVKRQEEKTLLLEPGQTIEPKSIIETFENPVEEIIQNPNGTTTSLIKQTKIIITTENVPIEENKIKSLEGPMVKQYITYEYKTATSIKENGGQGFDGQNQLRSSNLMNQSSSPMKYGQQEDNHYGGNLKDQRNINPNSPFGNENLGENAVFQVDENVKSNFTPDVLPKGFKSEEEIENFLNKINQNGENATPEEKEKRLKCIEDIFKNISKGGENPEKNLQKLSELLANINGKDRQEILAKLGKDFPENEELFKKLANKVHNNLNKKSKFSANGHNRWSSEENIYVKGVNPLNFEGLFLDISKYNNEHREKNPFEGPSPYCKFYKERKIKIKQKIHDMASGEIENDDNEK